MKVHIHANLVQAFITLLEVLIALIPVKILAAHFAGRSSLADGILYVI